MSQSPVSRELNSSTAEGDWLDLQTDIAFTCLDEKVNIVQSVPFIRRGLYLDAKHLFKLTVYCLNFRHVAIERPVDDKLLHVVYAILFSHFGNFCLNHFGNFHIELFTKFYDVFFRSDIGKVILLPFFKCLGSTFSDGFRSRTDIPFEIQLEAVHRAVQNPFFSH